MHVLEVQVLVGGAALLPLLARGSALVSGALQVVLVVHLHGPREHVVHDHHARVCPSGLHTVQPVELGQKCPWVLI